MRKNLSTLAKPFVALVIYIAFTFYLCRLHIDGFIRWDYLLLVNPPLAALGCYILSRRWVPSFAGSFFAGVIYGFGPFMLGLGRFHPTAGSLAAVIPWLFCPAAFISKTRRSWIATALSLLPFLAIIFFFHATIHFRLFAIPKQARLHLADLLGLISPLVSAKRGLSTIGFYHIPLAALLMGFSMLLAARRFGIMMIIAVGAALSFCRAIPQLEVSPIIWFSIPAMCCSILIGVGMQGLICSGFGDRKIVLAITVIIGALAIVTLLLATKYFQVFAGLASGYARVFTDTGKLFTLGALVTATIFFMARAKLRLFEVRWLMLGAAISVDIFLGARFIIDRVL